jgi:chitin disaccharide deacetylase
VLIINADDFGLNENTNAAIVNCFEKGLCSSTTIMPNMPGFEHACRLAHEKKLLNHVGLHIVLTEGYPLTEAMKRQERFCDISGQFILNRTKRIFHLSVVEQQVLAEEIRAQVIKCRDNGLPLTHVDSHHNVHEELGVFFVLMHIMNEFEIPYLRVMFNLIPARTFIRRAYTTGFNYMLRTKGLARTRRCGSLADYLRWKEDRNSLSFFPMDSCELMTHPISNDGGVIVDALDNRPIEELIKEAGPYRKAESFSGAVYAAFD